MIKGSSSTKLQNFNFIIIMHMEELLDFINKVDEHLVQQDTNHDPKIHSLIASIKLSEEVGEFNEQLL
ncbi:MAG: hypothetical protein WCL02_02155 [bacterium]